MNHFLPEKCVMRPSIFNWLWRGSHQKSAKGRNFPFSCLCKIYIIAINGILAFCSYVIIDSQTPMFGWYYSSKTYIHAVWINFFNKLFRKTQISLGIRPDCRIYTGKCLSLEHSGIIGKSRDYNDYCCLWKFRQCHKSKPTAYTRTWEEEEKHSI